jgi:hypothetical protein
MAAGAGNYCSITAARKPKPPGTLTTAEKGTDMSTAGEVMRDSVAMNLAICVLQTRPLPGDSGVGSPFMEVAMATGEDGRPGFSAGSSLVEIANAISKMLI